MPPLLVTRTCPEGQGEACTADRSSGRRSPGTASGRGDAARGGWDRGGWSPQLSTCPLSSLSFSAERFRLCSHWSEPRHKCILLSPQPCSFLTALYFHCQRDSETRPKVTFPAGGLLAFPPALPIHPEQDRQSDPRPWVSLGSGSAALATGAQVQPHVTWQWCLHDNQGNCTLETRIKWCVHCGRPLGGLLPSTLAMRLGQWPAPSHPVEGDAGRRTQPTAC